MRTRKQKKYCCNSCDKKTPQTKFSEGITENIYYVDYKCDICGTINPFPTKFPKDNYEVKN